MAILVYGSSFTTFGFLMILISGMNCLVRYSCRASHCLSTRATCFCFTPLSPDDKHALFLKEREQSVAGPCCHKYQTKLWREADTYNFPSKFWALCKGLHIDDLSKNEWAIDGRKQSHSSYCGLITIWSAFDGGIYSNLFIKKLRQ